MIISCFVSVPLLPFSAVQCTKLKDGYYLSIRDTEVGRTRRKRIEDEDDDEGGMTE